MRHTNSAVIVITLSLGALLAAAAFAQAPAPPLSGTVVKATGGALTQAKVELLAPGTERVVHHVYTDSRGRFAVHQVAKGSYDLRIRYGNQVLSQKSAGSPVKVRRVVLNGSPKRLTIQLS